MPEVSVITPSYNASATLAQTIASVQAQSHSDWEHLIVDDGSHDGSAEIAEMSAQQDDRIRVWRLENNHGAAQARNVALEHSHGRYIAFLDADDLWIPEKLTRQLAFMKAQNAAFSFTAYARVSKKGRESETIHAPARLDYAALLKRNQIGCLTVMYDTASLGRQPMPDMAMRHDWALWLRLLKQTPYAFGLDEVLATHHVQATSLSSNKFKAASHAWRMLRDVEKLGLARATWNFSHYAMYHIAQLLRKAV